MYVFATGAAFVDRAGAVVGADAGFLHRLGLDAADPAGALRRLAERTPALGDLLAGRGPPVVRLPAGPGEVELERVPAGGGALLVVRDPREAEWREHAMRSQGLTGVAAGLAHDVKNPLNAMALQLALLGDKLAATPEASAAAANHLGALRDQIARVNEVIRRFLDVTDPSAPLGYVDLGALLADTASLFGHDARRRGIGLAVEAPGGPVRTCCDPGRVGRVVLGLLSWALATTPDGGRISARAEGQGDRVVVRLARGAADPDRDSGYDREVIAAAAEALGGALEVVRRDGTEHLALHLPRTEAP